MSFIYVGIDSKQSVEGKDMGNFLDAAAEANYGISQKTGRKQKSCGSRAVRAVVVITVLTLALGREKFAVLYTGLEECRKPAR
jgi:hypothetical protein